MKPCEIKISEIKGIYVNEHFTKEILVIETRKSLQLKLEEERKKGNIAHLRGNELIIKNLGDVTREKGKRELSFSPRSGCNKQNQSSSSASVAQL